MRVKKRIITWLKNVWWSVSILTFLMLIVSLLQDGDIYEKRENVTIISLFWLFLIFPMTPVGVWFKQDVLAFEKEWDMKVKNKDWKFFLKRYGIIWVTLTIFLTVYLLVGEYII